MDYILKSNDEGDMEKVARLIQLEDGVAVCQDYCGKTIVHRSVMVGNMENVKRIVGLDSRLLDLQDNVRKNINLQLVTVDNRIFANSNTRYTV